MKHSHNIHRYDSIGTTYTRKNLVASYIECVTSHQTHTNTIKMVRQLQNVGN